MSRRIVFLSQDSMDGYVCDDDVALPAFADAGIDVTTTSWRSDTDWSAFDAVIVRSTWDYQRAHQAFFDTLRVIDRQTRLANPLELMRWNMDKRYLAELARDGVATVPTVFGEGLAPGQLRGMLESVEGPHVIKPVISAGAERTFRVAQDMLDDALAEIEAAHRQSAWMWQPFLKNIVSEGEYSLFYFSGALSHAILKAPKPGDFRVQEEFGGAITAIDPDANLRAAGDAALASIDAPPLYARVDLVRGNRDDAWQLIELELIEPSLYLRMDSQAPARFARSVKEWLDD
ncbi:MAG: hypothetical protein AAFO81_09050 [Pseudomonadota bacterium]